MKSTVHYAHAPKKPPSNEQKHSESVARGHLPRCKSEQTAAKTTPVRSNLPLLKPTTHLCRTPQIVHSRLLQLSMTRVPCFHPWASSLPSSLISIPARFSFVLPLCQLCLFLQMFHSIDCSKSTHFLRVSVAAPGRRLSLQPACLLLRLP